MRFLVAGLLAAIQPLASTASADNPGYEAWIDHAMQAVEFGDLARARVAFENAHRVEASARALRGMGIVSYRMGDYARSLVELEAALAERNRPLPDDLRASVESLLVDLQDRVVYLLVNVEPEGATITVDGEAELHDAQGRLVVAAGPHELRAAADHHEPQVVTLNAEGGAVVPVKLVLRAAAPDTGVADVAPIPAAPEATAAPPARKRVWTWIAAGAVPVFLAGAAAAWVRTEDIGDGLVETCRSRPCTREERRARIDDSDLATFETLTNAGLGLAAASAVAAGVLFLIEGEDQEVAVEGRSVTVRVRF